MNALLLIQFDRWEVFDIFPACPPFALQQVKKRTLAASILPNSIGIVKTAGSFISGLISLPLPVRARRDQCDPEFSWGTLFLLLIVFVLVKLCFG